MSTPYPGPIADAPYACPHCGKPGHTPNAEADADDAVPVDDAIAVEESIGRENRRWALTIIPILEACAPIAEGTPRTDEHDRALESLAFVAIGRLKRILRSDLTGGCP